MLHKSQFGWIGRTQKTTKTECGKRVACSAIAVDADTDCPACRTAVDASTASMLVVATSFDTRPGCEGLIGELQACADDPNRYRTIYFL